MRRSRRRRGRERKEDRKHLQKKCGGTAFFISLFFLLFLAVFNLILLPALWDNSASTNWRAFLAGAVIGLWFARSFIAGHLSVFVHELKHSVISNLAGNRAKKMHIKRESGYFEYSYTKETEQYNAFIQLAPYWLPLASFVSLIFALVFFRSYHIAMVFLLGLGYGTDSLLNLRDISPIQTDLTRINGGYNVALLYIVAMNTAVFTILAAWVSQGLFGLQFLLYGLWRFMTHVVAYYMG